MAYLTVEDTTGSIELLVFPKTYDIFAPILREGGIFVFTGRVSTREDEDIKIICSGVKSPDDISLKKDKVVESTKKKRSGLFLKFNDENDSRISRAEKYMQIFDGNLPVYYYFESTKKYVLQPSSKFISINDPLLSELRKLLGKSNVVVQ